MISDTSFARLLPNEHRRAHLSNCYLNWQPAEILGVIWGLHASARFQRGLAFVWKISPAKRDYRHELPNCRQTGNCPEMGLGDINGDLPEADLWPAITSRLLVIRSERRSIFEGCLSRES
jgi:hypothetical protein